MKDQGSRRLVGSFVVTVAALALCAPFAQAAPPGNDNFANREALNGSLPIEVTRSNVEATEESGEFVGLDAARHSVWFSWVAQSTGWITVGACASSFPAIVAVSTGTEIGHLEWVVSANTDQGPHCPYQRREYTFKATKGTEYSIAVDGNAFTPSGPPVTEGSFTLHVEETPVPANDDFADAADVSGNVSEDHEGHRFFSTSIDGANWRATKEAEEPDHAGVSKGASVWYRWTAPESGIVYINACCRGNRALAVYTGSSLTALTPLVSSTAISLYVEVPVSAGAEYRIAIDGAEEGATGEAAMASFTLNLRMNLSALPGGKQLGGGVTAHLVPMPVDVLAPQTTILERIVKPRRRKATFGFTSSEAGGGFRCKLDDDGFGACDSPKSYAGLGPGKHVFRVAAVDSAGNADSSPAVARFAIPKPKARHRNMH